MMNTVLSRLDQFDIFGIGTPSPLNIKGKEKVPSRLGLFLTFFTMVSLIVLAVIIFLNFLRRGSPYVVQSNLKGVLQDEPFYLNNDNFSSNSFNFGFSIYDKNSKKTIVDPRYFRVVAKYSTWNSEDKDSPRVSDYKDVPICTDRFPVKAYCLPSLDPEGSATYILDYRDVLIDILVMPCRNSTSKVTCAPQDEIDSKIAYSILYIYRDEWYIDPMNYENPISPIDPVDTRFYVALTTSNLKIINLFLNKVEVVTDDGWLFESEKRQNVTTLEEYILDFQQRMFRADGYAAIKLQTKCNKVVYNRKYAKVQDVLAQVNGLASWILLVFGFLIVPYSRIKMQETLVNEVFQLRTKPGSSSKIVPTPSSPRQNQETKGKESKPKSPSQDNLKMNKGISSPILKKQNSELSKTDIETNSKSNSLCISEKMTSKENSQEKPKSLRKSVIVPVPKLNKNNGLRPTAYSKAKTLELPTRKMEETAARQHQPISVSGSLKKLPSLPEEEEISHKVNDLIAQNENIEGSPQEHYTLETKESNIDTQTEFLEESEPPNPDQSSLLLAPKIQISFSEWALSFVSHRPQVKILEKASDEIFKNLDLVTLSKRIAEIDMLKAILLTREQRVIFEDLSRKSLLCDPKIYPQSSSVSIMVKDWDMPDESNEKELESAIESLSQSQSKSSIDVNLLSHYRKKCLK